MKLRPDLLDERSPEGLEVIQLTTETEVPSTHLYMEAQVFTPDSRRLVLHRSATAHGSNPQDPNHQYLRCDLDDHCSLHPLTVEVGVTGASVSPDGRYVYYFVDETTVGGGRLTLKRVNLDGTERCTITVVDAPLPGTRFRPSCIYPLSTISADGQRIAISAFLGDGSAAEAPWGLMVFDIAAATVQLILHGPTWCNLHAQYCRSSDPEESHDILIQENHGNETDARGEVTRWLAVLARTSTSFATTARTSATCPGGATATRPARATSAGAGAAPGRSPAPAPASRRRRSSSRGRRPHSPATSARRRRAGAATT